MAPGLLDWVTKNTFSSVRDKGNTPRGVRELLSGGVVGRVGLTRRGGDATGSVPRDQPVLKWSTCFRHSGQVRESASWPSVVPGGLGHG